MPFISSMSQCELCLMGLQVCKHTSKFICKIKVIPNLYSPLGQNSGRTEPKGRKVWLMISELCSLSQQERQSGGAPSEEVGARSVGCLHANRSGIRD